MLFDAIYQYHEICVNVARTVDVDYRALEVLMWMESRGNATVISPAGAVGLMQVMPGEIIKGRPAKKELLHPQTNIYWGAKILKHALDTFGGSYEKAIPAYFLGEDGVLDNERYGKKKVAYLSEFVHVWRSMFADYLPWENPPRGFEEGHE